MTQLKVLLYSTAFCSEVFVNGEDKTLGTPLSVMQSSTTAPSPVTSVIKHISEFTKCRQSQQKLNIINFIQVEFIAEPLY